MRTRLLFVSIIVSCIIFAGQASAQQSTPMTRILAAKSAYFDDATGVQAIGAKAFAQLEKWGRFRFVQSRQQADLIILLSSDPYKGGYILMSGGETGTIDNGKIEEDAVPIYNPQVPVRYAYLTVLDAKTGETLWIGAHRWGGLLTGFNSAGEKLVKELAKKAKK